MASQIKIALIIGFFLLQFCCCQNLFGQTINNNYTNPIIHEDYSDPDVVRVGNHFYMTASSFTATPGLPLLHSTDLVHWNLIGYALNNNVPVDYYKKVQHGAGVWAPSIRYHNGEFYIYYPDPDFGIYVIKSKTITGKWSDPILVLPGKGFIDPCPLWDDNDKVYLVHAYSGSRAGIKSVLALKEMNTDGTKIIDNGKLIYDGHEIDPTVEGPKIYKRNGWYYIFAPAGGVSTGWQIVLRSKNIYGPYERKKVMEQGVSTTNGPHQGAWVQTNTGEDWFIHFQDKGAYGRITHLQPIIWKYDWPVIGEDNDGDGIGTPVLNFASPKIKRDSSLHFSNAVDKGIVASPLQWNANPEANWRLPYLDSYRNYAVLQNDSIVNLWNFPALYLRKLPAEKFTATTHIYFNSLQKGERTGFILFGKSYASIELKHTELGLVINYIQCDAADKGSKEVVKPIMAIACVNNSTDMFLRLQMNSEGVVQFAYSMDGVYFTTLENTFKAVPGVWVGAKLGYYCSGDHIANDAGYVEIKSLDIKNN